jgi:hypothetical protein
MKRFTRIVLLLLLVEIVIAAALGTRVRRQLEQPVTYLGKVIRAAPADGFSWQGVTLS